MNSTAPQYLPTVLPHSTAPRTPPYSTTKTPPPVYFRLFQIFSSEKAENIRMWAILWGNTVGFVGRYCGPVLWSGMWGGTNHEISHTTRKLNRFFKKNPHFLEKSEFFLKKNSFRVVFFGKFMFRNLFLIFSSKNEKTAC